MSDANDTLAVARATEEPTTTEAEETVDAPDESAEPAGAAPQYGVGPFSIREVVLGGIWLVAFVVSFFPVNLLADDQIGSLIGAENVWTSGLAFILTIGLPTVAVFLIALRRLSPQGIRRFGSLSIDQLASIAFTISAILWLQIVWDTIAIAMATGIWVRSWVIWVELVLMAAGVVFTVAAPLIPVLRDDFRDRAPITAHPNARPVRTISPRPAPVVAPPAPTDEATASDDAAPSEPVAAPVPAAAVADAGVAAPAGDADVESADTTETTAFGPLGALEDSDTAPSEEPTRPAAQAFWALVPEERDVVDDYGTPMFRIGPTAWALVIDDRGETFVVRHEDGRIGYLHDVSGVTRG